MADLVEELRALARVEPSADAFTIAGAHGTVQVEISRDSDGDFSGLALRVPYDEVARATPGLYRDADVLSATRPLAIELRREHAGDRAAKADGTSVEHQTGDAAFDAEIYVSTPTSDPRVLGAVLGPQVRSAVRELIAIGFVRVVLDSERGLVEAHRSRDDRRPSRPVTAQSAIATFERLGRALPAVVHSGGTHAAPPLGWLTSLLGIVGAAGWLLNVTWVGLLAMAVDAVRPGLHDGSDVPGSVIGGAIGISIVAGLAGALAYGELVRSLARGSSRAHELVGKARLAAFGGASVITMFVCALAALVLYG